MQNHFHIAVGVNASQPSFDVAWCCFVSVLGNVWWLELSSRQDLESPQTSFQVQLWETLRLDSWKTHPKESGAIP